MAVAGPLAGLVFAIPALLIGLRFSEVDSSQFADRASNIGSSVLLACLAKMSLGVSVLEGESPAASSAGLRRLAGIDHHRVEPAAHRAARRRAHFPRAVWFAQRARGEHGGAGFVVCPTLFVWPGLMFWAIIVLFIAGTHDAPAVNDVYARGLGAPGTGYFAFLLLLLILVPVPHSLYETIGIHCPYL